MVKDQSENKQSPKTDKTKNKTEIKSESLGLKIAVGIFAFVPIVVLGALVLAFGIAGIVMVITGLAYLPLAIVVLFQDVPVGLGTLGAGLFVLGLGILFIKGAAAICSAGFGSLFRFFLDRPAPKPTKSKILALKNCWIFIAIFMISGLSLFAASLGLGSSGKYAFIDGNGVHVSSSNENNPMFITEPNVEAFTSINASTIAADIELIPSDSFRFEAKLPPNSNGLDWSVTDGVLTIDTQNNWSWRFRIFDLDFLDNNYYLKIYYPAGSQFDQVKLHSVAGDLNGGTQLSTRDLAVDTVSGNLIFNVAGCEQVDMSTTSGDITFNSDDSSISSLLAKTVSGRINLKHVIWQNLTAKSVSGDIEIGGEAGARTLISSVSGSVRLGLLASSVEYTYDISSLSGNITVNEQRLGNPAHSTITPPSDQQIGISTTSGDIALDFND